MYALSSKVLLGLLYAVTIALCSPHPSHNHDTVTFQKPDTPVLDYFSHLRKRSKAGEVAGQVRTALDIGSSGVPKLVGDVLKLQQDLEGIVKQLKASGMIPGSKKDTKTQDPKQNAAVTDADSTTEVILADDDLASKTNSTQEAPSPAVLKTAP
ncbi:hypothetical protein PCANC_01229 [Puccinia coronata f. sp. avenae]|uniref:Uncharacterized protein n=1 Tax=Puccinia coronata f. sp. avenae TaxID=200324 RepID=A0A2N5T726_9BASI|nr:hypothetical protein PCANC_05031 [Puccinia coronata f. sp. avenae]PLW44301.1 hypothetical protein PCASD_03855 [Puccinia coronata f. sp. avenae]PLW56935.1 hypothetical protein PCANC_01229 [Puccinia coronata f. sp. avenae]